MGEVWTILKEIVSHNLDSSCWIRGIEEMSFKVGLINKLS